MRDINGAMSKAPSPTYSIHRSTGDHQCRAGRLSVFVRRGLLPGDDAQVMGHWEHRGCFSVRACAALLRRTQFGLEQLRQLEPNPCSMEYQARPRQQRPAAPVAANCSTASPP